MLFSKSNHIANKRKILELEKENIAAKALIDGINPTQLEGREQSSHHLYVVFIDYGQQKISRHELMKQLFSAGIGTQVHYIPVPMHPYYESLGYDISDYPVTHKHYQMALSIPLYYELSNKDQDKVVKSLIKLLTEK